MKVIDCEQNSPEWFSARLGHVTASRIADVTAKGKAGAPSASRANYAAQLVAELLTGKLAETFTSAAMQHGTETEPEARAMYEFMNDTPITQVGFVLHPTIVRAGASPDGLIGSNGIVQFKCPQSAAHLKLLLGGSIDGGYFKQVQWEMACTERAFCDFASYDPKMPEDMQLHVRRIERDDAVIAELEAEARVFIAEIDAPIAKLNAKYRQPIAA